MAKKKTSNRELKKKLLKLFPSDDIEIALKEAGKFPARRVINPLISFLFSNDEKIKQSAVTTIGIVVSRLADENMESARVIMRRLMWSLNDESGSIGWGAPEAMAEIMARHRMMAEEYHKILISYAAHGKNYLENETLQESARQGIKRLAEVRPELFDGYTEICDFI